MLTNEEVQAAHALPERMKRELRTLKCPLLGGQAGWFEFAPMDAPKYNDRKSDVVVIPERMQDFVEFLSARAGAFRIDSDWLGDWELELFGTLKLSGASVKRFKTQGGTVYAALLLAAALAWPEVVKS